MDLKFTAYGYWQAVLQYNFLLSEGYAVLYEQSPDEDDRSRIDQIMFRLIPGEPDILMKAYMVEGKRKGILALAGMPVPFTAVSLIEQHLQHL